MRNIEKRIIALSKDLWNLISGVKALNKRISFSHPINIPGLKEKDYLNDYLDKSLDTLVEKHRVRYPANEEILFSYLRLFSFKTYLELRKWIFEIVVSLE